MGRVLGIDYGTVRVGLAISDPTGIIAQPVQYVPAENRKQCLARIAEICRERDVVEIVLGLPRNMDGSEGKASGDVRKFGSRLEAGTGVKLSYFDERLTTKAVERILIEGDVSRAKRREKRDSMAAALILQNYLDAKSGG